MPAAPIARLTEYDWACGRTIDAAFARFQGMDPSPTQWVVFATLVHRQTGGRDDRSCNPLRVRGAGWAGLVGVATHGKDGTGTASFETNADGCRAAAVLCQFAEYRSVQLAYRTGDCLLLAAAVAASPLRGVMHLDGLVDEVRARLPQRRGPRSLVRLALIRLRVLPEPSALFSSGPD